MGYYRRDEKDAKGGGEKWVGGEWRNIEPYACANNVNKEKTANEAAAKVYARLSKDIARESICVQQDNNHWDIKWTHKLFGIYSWETKH